MTIQWGAYHVVGGTGLRMGIEIVSISTPTNGSTTCTVQFTIWSNPGGSGATGSNYNGDAVTVSQSATAGSLSPSSFASVVDGSANGSSGPINEQHGGTQTLTYTYSDYGASHNVNITVGITGTFNGSAPTQTVTVTIPARPYSTPTAPSALSASRVSDTQISVGWTNNSTASGLYQSLSVYRSTDGGGMANIANPGIVTSYNDTGCTANHKYTYQIGVSNSAGSSNSSVSSAVWTTPGAPTSLTATKIAGGNIRLTWTNNVNYSEYQTDIYESQNGGAYVYVNSVAAGVTQWDHVAPSTGVTHKYKVLANKTGSSLFSAFSNESATITLLSTAGAPTGLAPAGVTKDATEAIVFTWTHNPTDGTPQTKYQLQYKIGAGSFVTVGPTTSGVSSYTMPASTVTNGQTITWHVATAGENGTIGAYSADSVFTTQDRPTSTITVPAGSTHNLSHLTAEWTYFQAQSALQAGFHAYLWKKGALGDYSDATLVGEAAGSGTTDEVAFDTTLLDGQTYKVRVFVTSATGLQSSESGTDSQEFTVTYLPPADATLVATYDPEFGHMVIDITGTAATGGVTEPIDTVDLQRQINGGEWVTWVTGIVLSVGTLQATVIDTAPIIKGNNNYRAIIRSAVPSSVLSAEVDVDVNEKLWGFLSAGNGFVDVVRMRARLSNRASVGREKSTYKFAGRSKPVELSGEGTDLGLSVLATLYPPSQGGLSSEPEELEELALTTGIVLWRDYKGRRIFASISGVNVDYVTQANKYPVAFVLTQVDYDENVG